MGAATKPMIPIIEDVEKEEEESHEGERRCNQEQVVVAVHPRRGSKGDGDDPEMREDDVEKRQIPGMGPQEEGDRKEDGRQDRNDKDVNDLITPPIS